MSKSAEEAYLSLSDDSDQELTVPSSDEVLDAQPQGIIEFNTALHDSIKSGVYEPHMREVPPEMLDDVVPVPVCIGTKWRCFCRFCHPPDEMALHFWDDRYQRRNARDGYTHTRG